MSRFEEVVRKDDKPTISESDLRDLVEYSKIKLQLIKESIRDWFSSVDKEYCVFEESQDTVVTVCKSDVTKTVICVGYPFPIYEEEIEIEIIPNCVTKIHIRSGEFRRKQYRFFVEQMRSCYSSVVDYQINDTSDFQEAFKVAVANYGGKRKKAVFCDYNRFIGDSIISLELADIIKEHFNIESLTIISSNKKHISNFYKSIEYESEEVDKYINEADIIFFADFLDSHISLTTEIIKRYKPQGMMVLLSRNVFICPGENTHINKLIAPDVLLTNQGIHRYLPETILPFIGETVDTDISSEEINAHADHNESFFINPFSSKELKDIPIDFVQKLICKMIKNTSYRICISRGLNGEYEQNYIEKLMAGLPGEYHSRIEFICEENLALFSERLIESNVKWGITADTSISHMLTRMKMKNFTMYRRGFWDETSVLSMATESPLGYCGLLKYQLPIIYEENKCNEQVEAVLRIVAEGYMTRDIHKKRYGFSENKPGQNIENYSEILEQGMDDDYKKAIDSIFETEALFEKLSKMSNAEYLIQNVFLICPQLKLID